MIRPGHRRHASASLQTIGTGTGHERGLTDATDK